MRKGYKLIYLEILDGGSSYMGLANLVTEKWVLVRRIIESVSSKPKI